MYNDLDKDIQLFKKYVKDNIVIMLASFFTMFNVMYASTERFNEVQAVRLAEAERQKEFDAKFITQAEYHKLKNPEKYANKPLTPLEMQKLYNLDDEGRPINMEAEIATRTMMAGL